MNAIERFKLLEPDIPGKCIEELERAKSHEAESRRPEAIEAYESVLAEFGETLSASSRAEILISLGHIYLALKKRDKARECVDTIMQPEALGDRLYGRAQVLQAFIEASNGPQGFENARSVIDKAEGRYNDDPTLELMYAITRHTLSLREASN